MADYVSSRTGAEIDDAVTNGTTSSGNVIAGGYGTFVGGVYVGANTDPGDDNLVVDGTASIKGNLTIGDANTDAHSINGILTGFRREVIRQSAYDNTALPLTVAQSGALIMLDEDEAYTITLPAITANDLGVTYEFIETVASTNLRKIVTKYNNDYFVGGVTNTFDAIGDTDDLKTFVSTGGTDTTISFDDDLNNCGGGLGARVVLTSVLTGNTGAGGGAKLVWAVSGNTIAKELADTGAAIFS